MGASTFTGEFWELRDAYAEESDRGEANAIGSESLSLIDADLTWWKFTPFANPVHRRRQGESMQMRYNSQSRGNDGSAAAWKPGPSGEILLTISAANTFSQAPLGGPHLVKGAIQSPQYMSNLTKFICIMNLCGWSKSAKIVYIRVALFEH